MAPPTLMSATHSPALALWQMLAVAMVRLSELGGTSKATTPPVVPSALAATVPRFAARKSSPGRVTRTDAELGMTDACGKPSGRGVIPHPEHPEHPPAPLQEARTMTIRTKNAGRNDQRSMQSSTNGKRKGTHESARGHPPT